MSSQRLLPEKVLLLGLRISSEMLKISKPLVHHTSEELYSTFIQMEQALIGVN